MLKSGTCVCLLALVMLGASCRKGEKATGSAAFTPVVAPELAENAMSKGGPQGFLASRAASPVHWQHWEPGVLQRARDAGRLVFALIGASRYPGCIETLDAIDRDKMLVERLNREFVPVLVDLDLCPEAGLAATVLCQEIRLPISFPFILVLSPDGNEVTWRPVPYSAGADIHGMFDGATEVVANMWRESPEYVERNSMLDHDNRLGRLPKPDATPATPAERDALLARALRQLASFYEADAGTMSGAGGLLPLGILQCLASASLDPDTPPEMARRSREVVGAFGRTILNSAMVDPLDGGVYSSRRGNSWDLPMTQRCCNTQARAARALVTLYRATGDPRALEVALGAVKFAEEQYTAQGGLFVNQRLPGTASPADWLWSQEQIDQALSGPEAALWKTLCGISGMGNLAIEADPTREYFRLNSLGFRSTLAAAAEKQGIPAEDASKLLESGRKKLLKARTARVPDRLPSPAASAAPSFRMVSAYAALFTATGDPKWREKAISLAQHSRQTFASGNSMVEQSSGETPLVCDARAFTYALAIQAGLDLAEITLDESWRIWAGDLTSMAAEAFVDDAGRLREARPASTPLRLPVEDRVMLFDDSTAGLMRMNLARLEALGQTPPPALAPWLHSLPAFTVAPVIFTDSILAASFSRSRVVIHLPENAPEEWREAACRLPLDRIARDAGKVPAPKAVRPGGEEIPLETPASLETLVRPPGP
jgi:uncharacterized protein YyaL (SSP411 family)